MGEVSLSGGTGWNAPRKMVGVAEGRVALRAPRRNFHVEAANRLDVGQLRPCRTADSMFSIFPLASRRLFLSFSLSLFLSLAFFQDSVRAYNYQRHASPRTLSSRGPPSPLSTSYSPPSYSCAPSTAALPRAASRAILARSSVPANTRKKPRLTADSTGSYTARPLRARRSRGAPLPYDFHVSASGPPKLHDRALYLT